MGSATSLLTSSEIKKEQFTVTTSSSDIGSDNIDLLGILGRLLRYKRAVFFSAALFFISALLIYLYTRNFNSQGLYQLSVPRVESSRTGMPSLTYGRVSFAEYKRISGTLTDQTRLRQFLDVRRAVNPEINFSHLLNAAAKLDGMSEFIEPKYVVSKADSKELVDYGAKENASTLLGIQISAKAHTAEVANKIVNALAEYVREQTFRTVFDDYLIQKVSDLSGNLIQFESDVLQRDFQLRQLRDKVSSLEKLKNRYLPLADSTQSTVVGLSDSTIRYLPIRTQLIATEAAVDELNQISERARRDKIQQTFMLLYYQRLRKDLTTMASFDQFLSAMPQVRDELGGSLTHSDENIRQATLGVEQERVRLQDSYFTQTRFISVPSNFTSGGWLRLAATSIGVSIIGALIACLYAIATTWLTSNKERFFSAIPPKDRNTDQ